MQLVENIATFVGYLCKIPAGCVPCFIILILTHMPDICSILNSILVVAERIFVAIVIADDKPCDRLALLLIDSRSLRILLKK